MPRGHSGSTRSRDESYSAPFEQSVSPFHVDHLSDPVLQEVDDFTEYQDKYLAKKKEEKEDLFQPRYEEYVACDIVLAHN